MQEETAGIKPSKKFAVGTIHENGTGKFQILDRYIDKDSKKIMLKYQWIESGLVEENKEVNITASIWKFHKSRGLIDSPKESSPIEGVSFKDVHDLMLELQRTFAEEQQGMEERLGNIQNELRQQSNDIKRLLEAAIANTENLKALTSKYDLASKLVDKL